MRSQFFAKFQRSCVPESHDAANGITVITVVNPALNRIIKSPIDRVTRGCRLDN